MQYAKDPKSTMPGSALDGSQRIEAAVAKLETDVDEVYAGALSLLDLWTAIRDKLLQASASQNGSAPPAQRAALTVIQGGKP